MTNFLIGLVLGVAIGWLIASGSIRFWQTIVVSMQDAQLSNKEKSNEDSKDQ